MAGKKIYSLDAHSSIVDADVFAISATASGDAEKATMTELAAYIKAENNSFDKSSDTLDDITDGATYVKSENNFTDALDTKLDGIEALADVTDATNVAAAGAVMNTGNETVAGIKTFSSSPIVPAPSTDLQAATKKYVDDNAGGTPEGTAVKSTGEVGASKFLREDGDGTCSRQIPAGAGDVSKVGTPVDNQVGVWTGDGTIEGTTGLTYDGSNFQLTGDIGATGSRITKAWLADLTLTNAPLIDGLTASEIVATDGSKNLQSLAVATYPSLTELAYVKGVTSAIQTQLDAKLADVVDDTTPQLGGDLDCNGNDILMDDGDSIKDENGQEYLLFNSTASAVNQVEITNSATGNGPTIDVGGLDTNVDLNIGAKGTGQIKSSSEMDFQNNSAGFTQQTATGDGTTTIDWKDGNKFKFTFGAFNETFTFTAPSNVCNLLLVMVQDGTGSRTATRPASVKRPGGTAPTLTTDASAVDIVSLYYDGTNYYAQTGLDFS